MRTMNDERKVAEERPAEVIRGVVSSVRSSNEDSVWSSGTIRRDGPGSRTVTFAGAVVVKVGDRVALHGSWQDDPKWGRQFKVEFGLTELPVDPNGLETLLATDERFPGIGAVKAKAIVKAVSAMGGDFGKIIADPVKRAELCSSSKVSPEALENVAKHWAASAEMNEAKTKLLGLGFTAREANSILRLVDPKKAVEEARSDPWSLAERIEGLGFKRADEVAKKSRLDPLDPRRIDVGIRHVVAAQLEEGHCWTDIPFLLGEAGDEKALGLRERDLLEARLEAMTARGDKLVKVELELERPDGSKERKVVVASTSILRSETNVAERICGRREQRNPHFVDGEYTLDKLKDLEQRANDDQVNAILAASKYKNVVITGPGGTGKTFTIAAITRLYQKKGKRVKIAAPTGKAAKRLFQTLREQGIAGEPTTIHKLLEYDPRRKGEGEWGRGSSKKLEADVVIIDETSMLDVRLASRVLEAMDDRAALILAGDHNQLPSVGPGAILRDLVTTTGCHIARLEKVVRQAGVLCQNSLEILKGVVRPTSAPDANGEYEWIVDATHNDEVSARDAVVAHFKAFLDGLGASQQTLQDVQVISPQKDGVLGINSLNVVLQSVAQKRVMGFDVPDPTKGRGGGATTEFFPGDKVLWVQNDYDLDLMNGDQGVVEDIGPAGVRLKTPFRDQSILVPNDKKKSLTLAYAVTAHKMQGSQSDHVIAVVHSAISKPLKQRSILYTAATRAAKSLVIVGNRLGIDEFAKEAREVRRRTFLPLKGKFRPLSGNVVVAEPEEEPVLDPEAFVPEPVAPQRGAVVAGPGDEEDDDEDEGEGEGEDDGEDEDFDED